MERQNIYKLIESKGTSSKEETNELWDIVRTFPYFQTARLLLTKSFQRQSSIHFHNELKSTAAYASDRKVLFRLMHDDRAKHLSNEENNVFAIEEEGTAEEAPVFKTSAVSSENQFALSPEREEYIEEPAFEIKKETKTPEVKFKKEPEVHKEEKIEEKKISAEHVITDSDEPATTNEEIIRRRLGEILSKNKPEKQEIVSPTPLSKVEETTFLKKEEAIEEKPVQTALPMAKEEEPSRPSVLNELPTETTDLIEGLELETIIEENYLQELERLPEIIKPATAHKSEGAKEEKVIEEFSKDDLHLFSFVDWLKQKNKSETTYEEVKDEPFFHYEIEKQTEKPVVQSSELINKFIENTPRIAPVKTEFYSPSNMARQSIIDSEDIISETLARIYFEQGNYLKARSCYEKLSLLYPKKSASFAPLIEKIDNILKETQI